MSTAHTLRFSALDTWFFRESRPFNTIGGSELASVFPPSPRTLLGAVRGAIGDALNADWRGFHRETSKYQLADGRCLSDLIGYSDGCGPLSMTGPWLVQGKERLYPVPLLLLRRSEAGSKTHVRLRIGTATHAPLGKVRLPELPSGNVGAKTMERFWVTGTGLARVLAGGLPKDDELRCAADLFTEEPRLGIARDNSKRVTGEGMLYQTRHLRPKGDLAIEAEIQDLPADVTLADRLIRLGGEGRLAHIESRQGSGALPPGPRPDARTRGLILVLLTPARLGEEKEDGWWPTGFVPGEENKVRIWEGHVAGVALTLRSAVVGKALREGGWNLAEHRPRDVVSLIPAGSCYYVTPQGDMADAVKRLHGARLGKEQELGRGQIACGLWNDNES